MKTKLEVNDKKWQAIQKLLPQIAGASVLVGIQSDAGAGDDGTPIVAYAAWNEFGTRYIPARSFIGSTSDEKRNDWSQLVDRLFSGILAGKLSGENAFRLLGEQAQSDIQQKVITLSEPPNSPQTIARKGSSNPLVDTGAMRAAIRYEVRLS
jgi:hypothetical protein